MPTNTVEDREGSRLSFSPTGRYAPPTYNPEELNDDEPDELSVRAQGSAATGVGVVPLDETPPNSRNATGSRRGSRGAVGNKGVTPGGRQGRCWEQGTRVAQQKRSYAVCE